MGSHVTDNIAATRDRVRSSMGYISRSPFRSCPRQLRAPAGGLAGRARGSARAWTRAAPDVRPVVEPPDIAQPVAVQRRELTAVGQRQNPRVRRGRTAPPFPPEEGPADVGNLGPGVRSARTASWSRHPLLVLGLSGAVLVVPDVDHELVLAQALHEQQSVTGGAAAGAHPVVGHRVVLSKIVTVGSGHRLAGITGVDCRPLLFRLPSPALSLSTE